jgi:hypothetical protein
MEKKQKTLAIAGAGIAAAAALGLVGASLANAAGEPSASAVAGPYGQLPGGGTGPGSTAPDGGRDGGLRDDGGTLTADAASKAVAAAQAEVDGGTVSSVRVTASGTYLVDVNKSDGTHVHVLLDSTFAVTSVQEGGLGGPGGRGGPDGDGDGDGPAGGTSPGGGTGSSNPSDANGTSTTSTST